MTLDRVAETTEQEKLKKEIETLQLALQKLIEQKQEAANHTYQNTSSSTQQNINIPQSPFALQSLNTARYKYTPAPSAISTSHASL